MKATDALLQYEVSTCVKRPTFLRYHSKRIYLLCGWSRRTASLYARTVQADSKGVSFMPDVCLLARYMQSAANTGHQPDGKARCASATRKYNGAWRYSSPITLDTGWKWVVSFTLQPHYPQGKSFRYAQNKKLNGPQSRSGRSRLISCTYRESNSISRSSSL